MPCQDPEILRLTAQIAAELARPPAARDQARITALSKRRAGAQKVYDAQVRLLGTARRQLGVPEDAYRAACRRLSGGRADGASHMTGPERARLLAEYRAKGFSPRPTKPRPAPTNSAGRLRQKIAAQLASLGRPAGYAETILGRQRGLAPGIAAPLAMATPTELRAVVAALDRQQQRTGAPRD